MFILWYQYDNTGIVFTGGFSFIFKFWHTQISAHNITVTYAFVKNFLYHCLSVWHRDWLNTGVTSNQIQKSIFKMNPKYLFQFLKRKYFQVLLHSSKKRLFPWILQRLQKKGISVKKKIIFCCYITQKEKSQRDFFKQ